jgi:hypothetical protein
MTALSISLVIGAAMLWGPEQAQSQEPAAQRPRPAPRLTLMESIRRYLPRVGATIDEAKSSPDLIVSNYTHPRGGKIVVVIQNKRDKNLLGLYIYNFGSLKGVNNREEIYRYLLSTNDAITIGSFFVDGDQDIGYKYLVSTEQPISLAVFQAAYVTMATVARDRKAEINRLLENSGNQ